MTAAPSRAAGAARRAMRIASPADGVAGRRRRHRRGSSLSRSRRAGPARPRIAGPARPRRRRGLGTARSRGVSGVRRTESGGRGAAGSLISGSSSSSAPAAEERQRRRCLGDASPRLEAVRRRGWRRLVRPPRRFRPARSAAAMSRPAGRSMLRSGTGRGPARDRQREVVTAVLAAIAGLESEVGALRALHRRAPEPRLRGSGRGGEQGALHVGAQAIGLGPHRIGDVDPRRARAARRAGARPRRAPAPGRAAISDDRTTGSGSTAVRSGAAAGEADGAVNHETSESVAVSTAVATAALIRIVGSHPDARRAWRRRGGVERSARADMLAARRLERRGPLTRLRRSRNTSAVSLGPPCSTARVSRSRAVRDVAGVVGVDAGVDELLALALAFGQRAARALDVGAGAAVAALEKHDARPDVDRLLVVAVEVLIEAGEQQLFDAGVAVRVGARAACTGWGRIGHQDWQDGGCRAAAIIGQNPARVNELRPSEAGRQRAAAQRALSTNVRTRRIPDRRLAACATAASCRAAGCLLW